MRNSNCQGGASANSSSLEQLTSDAGGVYFRAAWGDLVIVHSLHCMSRPSGAVAGPSALRLLSYNPLSL